MAYHSKPQQTSRLLTGRTAALGDKLIVFLLAVEFLSAVKLLSMLRTPPVILLNQEYSKRLRWEFCTSPF